MLLFEREFFALKNHERLLGKAINLRSEGRSNAERKIKYAFGKTTISRARLVAWAEPTLAPSDEPETEPEGAADGVNRESRPAEEEALADELCL